jgi:hypothetical protein
VVAGEFVTRAEVSTAIEGANLESVVLAPWSPRAAAPDSTATTDPGAGGARQSGGNGRLFTIVATEAFPAGTLTRGAYDPHGQLSGYAVALEHVFIQWDVSAEALDSELDRVLLASRQPMVSVEPRPYTERGLEPVMDWHWLGCR